MRWAFVAVILLALLGCSERGKNGTSESNFSETKIEWPPRTARIDNSASSIMPNAQLKLEIPKTALVKYSGAEESVGGIFVPIAGRFDVSEGKLVSKVGPIEKEASFKAWGYVYSHGKNKEVIGWGPCLTSGELIVSNIFIKSVPSDRMVENSFNAEDFGPNYTLIKLEPSKGHRLCIWIKEQDSGMRISPSKAVTKFGSGEIGGKCTESIDSTDDLLFITAGYIGTTATFGDKKFVRQQDGWYYGTKKVSK